MTSHPDDPSRCRGADPLPDAKIDPLLEQQFVAGRLYAAISSRPGQSGRADGYVLEGKELEVGGLCFVGCGADVSVLVLRQEAADWQAEARAQCIRYVGGVSAYYLVRDVVLYLLPLCNRVLPPHKV